ncbi:hypothetical protein NP233_g2220 [Leucocoprinus birnbaumii]|uniref:C2H2-type domain-containing protein n=1 Tax=Leucocoprinus birnbaumii TaxID=56174 RepID=A0AAD5YXE4_9AGAR|nr:hypothetical protein NP233_g2220 [Leucocoprinus birnbaumii]
MRLLISFRLLIIANHKCVTECGKAYSKAKGLARHQEDCSHLLRIRKKSQEIRSRPALRDITHAQVPLPASASTVSESASSQATHESLPVQGSDDHSSLPPMDIDGGPQHLSRSVSPAPCTTASGRPRRNYRLPKRIRDILPELPPPLSPPEHESEARAPSESSLPIRRVTLIVWDYVRTLANQFGLWREYPRRPTFDPDVCVGLDHLSNSHDTPSTDHVPDHGSSVQEASGSNQPSFWPFPNKSIQLLMGWLNNGKTSKSESEANTLVRECLLHPEFRTEDMKGFNANRENQRMDHEHRKSKFRSHFRESSVDILVPSGSPSRPPQHHLVHGLLHRNLTSVIADAFNDQLSHLIHYSPFKLFHQSPSNPSQNERVYGEVYTSDAFIEEFKNVQLHGELPPSDPHCKRERTVAALMFSSDATHLADFGNAKAWPVYVMLGNISKYVRSQPNSGALHHLAYIPLLPDSFNDFASKFHTSWRSKKDEIKAHCRRELMHGAWEIILDKEFIDAYRYGIVIKCIDGIERRIYPRIFSYSADYPEKVLLATIRDKGLFPCPRCLVHRSELQNLGLRRDHKTRSEKIRAYLGDKIATARRAIYDLGLGIRSSAVELLLRSTSAVPTANAFVERLGENFKLSAMFTVDLLHEIELGTWKSLFSHLIRILYSAGENLVSTLDERYRLVPVFGSGGNGIRRFCSNSSEMKQMAAHNFEDLLQCAIPCFDGLLPEPHDRHLRKLLYRFAEWHALAKLRMHSDTTLDLLDNLTREIGHLLRHFRDNTCSAFSTMELPREVAARQRRQASNQQVTSVTRSPKSLNLSTIKLHFMGDYVFHIRRLGTTDSYSTQLGEQAHQIVKRLYRVTNKKNALRQIGNKYIRHRALCSAKKWEEREAGHFRNLRDHHFISHSMDNAINVYAFVRENPGDPAKKGFIPKLKNHLLGRLQGRTFDADMHEDFSDADRNTIRIRNGTIFRHQTAQIHYTTYDVRRDYDTLNPRNRSFCMVASADTEIDQNAHPFWYAQVIGIFHADVQHTGANSRDFSWRTMEFLWVRWLGFEPGYSSGRRLAKLPKIGFVPEGDEYSFSFLDPAQVIRGCHLIPAFSQGRTNDLLSTQGQTEARQSGETDDWANYYVNIFAGCDMYMRYIGLGIGHRDSNVAANPDLEQGKDGLEEEGSDDENLSEEQILRTRRDEEDDPEDGEEEFYEYLEAIEAGNENEEADEVDDSASDFDDNIVDYGVL